MVQKRGFKNDIIKLREDGKSYNEIASILGCSKAIISRHLHSIGNVIPNKLPKKPKPHPFQKKIYQFVRGYESKNTVYGTKYAKTQWCRILAKIETFHRNWRSTMYNKSTFTVQDVIDKFGEKPRCYLTGIEIDIYDTSTYEFDHIVPRSRGGENTLDNLGIASKSANQSKRDMTKDEYLNLCKLTLEANGYTVSSTPLP